MALLQGPTQSWLRLGTAQPRNAKNRSPAEGKERKKIIIKKCFDLPFTCKGFILANYQTKEFL